MGTAIERALRRAVLNSLALHGRCSNQEGRIHFAKIRSILLVRPDRIGDAIISTPVIRHIRRAYPSARIDVLLGNKNRSIADMLPGVDGSYILTSRLGALSSLIRAIRSRRYDIAINLLLKPSASATLAMAAAGSGATIGFESSVRNLCDMPVRLEDITEHVVTTTSRLLPLIGAGHVIRTWEGTDNHLQLKVPEISQSLGRRLLGPDRLAILFNVSASSPERRPDAQWLSAAATRLSRLGARVVVAGAPDDHDLTRHVASAAGAVALSPTPLFPDFAGLISASGLVVSPDTAAVHVATAVATPVVVVGASSESAAQWYPWGPHHRVLERGDREVDLDRFVNAVISLADETSQPLLSSATE